MKTLKVQFVPVLVLSFCFAVRAYGQITPRADSYTNSATPTTNYGSKTLLDVDAASQITYIQFDLSSIPAGASIGQATLKLYVNSVTTGGSFNVDYVNGSWTEGTIDYTNAPALGGNIASDVSVTGANKNDYILINVTPALQAWLDGSQANDGIALVANSTFNATFDSKENASTSHPPELDIVYATIAGVTTATGSGLVGGGTSGTLNLSLTNTCAANQVLQWSGSGWGCASVGIGTITGVTAGTDLTGGGSNGAVTLNVDTSKVPQLKSSNTFAGNQTVTGNLTATGVVTGSGYQIGSNLFAFGSYANSNAFVGFAGNATMTGTSNAASGIEALFSNTTGNFNAAAGAYALFSNTTGYYNTAAGGLALDANTTGIYNTATGGLALAFNTTGSSNTASGGGALYNNTTGSSNTASGTYALLSNTTGNNNTANGAYSGSTIDNSNITGSSNTFVGASTDLSTGALSNATAIGANAEVAASNAMVLGSIKGVNDATANTNVGIGTTTPAATLDVHGTGNFTGLITFASGQTFPGTGTITAVNPGTDLLGGGNSGPVTLSVDTSKVVTSVLPGTDLTGGGTGGVQTLNLDITKVPQLVANNTFTGNQTVTGNLTATGVVTGSSYQIGSNLFDYGYYTSGNAFLGFAGNGNAMAGANSTGTGAGALARNTTGISNTANGAGALLNNTTGNYNTASGGNALWMNSAGSNNTANGVNALPQTTTGGYNTASGYHSGNTVDASFLTGSSNTFMGADSVMSNGTLNNATAIGANAEVGISNAMVLGSISGVNNCTSSNNCASTFVGIGTTVPGYLLHIGNQGGASYNNFLRIEGPASGSGNDISIGGHGDFAIDAVNVPAGRFVVKDNGIVAIGIPNPLGNPFQIAQGMGNALADGWATYSSRRWKTNILPLTNALNKVEQLRGVSYELKSSGKHEIGVIAEEVGAVVPEVVTYEENGKDARAVDYSRLTALLIEAIKQQQAEIRALRNREVTLESKLANLQRRRGQTEVASMK